jgi:hypothetical protein
MAASIAGAQPAGFPQSPFVDPQTGDIALVWRYFLMALYQRTGSGTGVTPTATAVAAETAARIAADTALSAAIAAETNARTVAENAEAATRAAADTALSLEIAALGAAAQSDPRMLARWWFGAGL